MFIRNKLWYMALLFCGVIILKCSLVFGGEDAPSQGEKVVKDPNSLVNVWESDSPYFQMKSKFVEFMASEPNDITKLDEKYKMASYFNTEYFPNRTNVFGKEARQWDQFAKAYKLYEHIIKHYPANEYKVLCSKAQLASLKLNLKKDRKGFVLGCIDVITTPVSKVTDSTDSRRNVTIKDDPDGMTKAQKDFEKYFKFGLRKRMIELSKTAEPELAYELLGQIITKCEKTDPEMLEMALLAKVKVDEKILGDEGSNLERLNKP